MTVCPESFFTTLKREEVYLHDYRTFEEAEANLSQFIEDRYKETIALSPSTWVEISILPPGTL